MVTRIKRRAKAVELASKSTMTASARAANQGPVWSVRGEGGADDGVGWIIVRSELEIDERAPALAESHRSANQQDAGAPAEPRARQERAILVGQTGDSVSGHQAD